MRRYGSIFLLLGTLCYGHAVNFARAAQKPAASPADTPKAPPPNQTQSTKAAAIAPGTPVITIDGLCQSSALGKNAVSCKTVLTRAQFEKVIDAIQPGMPERARRAFALEYIDFLVMTKKAEEMGLDKGPAYEEQMRVARIQILSKDLKNAIQEQASRISEKDIEDYYHKNIARFVTAEMDRIYIPKNAQTAAASGTSGRTMKEEAESLRARAVAGEEFAKLQEEAYQVAGIKTAAPGARIKIRSISLPPDQISAMDLDPGQVSPVLDDPSGYFIYKVETKNTLPLDQAREEIRATLRPQRVQEELDGIQDSVTSTLDEGYFVPGPQK